MITQNTFTDGLIMDLNPLTTPNTVLTDALNATIITYNGEEFVLQNDMGNCKVERAKLSTGFIPLGMREYGGIVYVVSYNPETGDGEVGAFPSPERDFSTSDFEELAPAKFKTSDFVVNTGQTDLKEQTSVLTKLVEPEILELNPGDMFLVTYDIHDPVPGSTAPDEIDTKAKMDFYISKDPTDRRLFKLRFFKLTDDNNLSEINPDDIKLVDAADDLEGQYVYFKEKNRGVIAVGLELEKLDTFDINVVDTSRKTDALKSAVIEAIGYSDSMAKFQGVRIDLTEPTVQSFFIDKTADVRKVSAKLGELVANSKLVGTVTPYSPYALYPKDKKDFNLELGKYASAGSGVNNIYKYFMGPNYVKVDFDFKLEGDNSNGLVLYVEFYDPWSDYSIIKVVDNPTYYGINSVVMETINEPTTDIFNSSQRGGTPTSALQINPDTSYLKTMLNTSGLIRNTATLRNNHFYIVRVSGIDVNVFTEPATYKHFDFYKALYTNTMFNDIYTLQNSIPVGSPQYVPDFMQLDFDLSKIKYTVESKESSNINASPITINQREDLMTNNRYYKISPTVLAMQPGYKNVRKFKNTKVQNLSLTLTGVNQIFGTFKENLLSVTTPTFGDSNSAEENRPTITDIDYDGDTDIQPNSYANWSLSQVNSKNYTLTSETNTERSVFSEVLSGTIQGNNYQELSLANQLYAPGNGLGWPSNHGAIRYAKYQIAVLSPDNVIRFINTNTGADDQKFNEAVENHVRAYRRGTSAILVTSNERTWFYPGYYHDCASSDPNGTAWWKSSLMAIQKGDGQWRVTRTHNYDTMVNFWTDLKVASSVQQTMQTYYPSQTIKANGQIDTRVVYPAFDLTTNFNPTAPGVKTYLSNIMFNAISPTRVDFVTATVNNYITTRLGTSVIVDGKNSIRDGFIPFITTSKQTVEKIKINDTHIIQSADSSVISRMSAGESQITTDPSLQPGRHAHNKLFTDNPNFQQWIPMVSLDGGNAGPVNVNNVSVVWNNTGGDWIGKNSKAGRCDGGDEAIDLTPSIMIT